VRTDRANNGSCCIPSTIQGPTKHPALLALLRVNVFASKLQLRKPPRNAGTDLHRSLHQCRVQPPPTMKVLHLRGSMRRPEATTKRTFSLHPMRHVLNFALLAWAAVSSVSYATAAATASGRSRGESSSVLQPSASGAARAGTSTAVFGARQRPSLPVDASATLRRRLGADKTVSGGGVPTDDTSGSTDDAGLAAPPSAT
jgi:hypothetical protein